MISMAYRRGDDGFVLVMQQYRLSIADLQVRQKEGSVEGAAVQELASWLTDGSIKSMEVILSSPR